MSGDVRNIATALEAIPEPWQPHLLASVNDYAVKVVKLDGEVHALLVEPTATVNTGDAGGERTASLRELG